MKIAHDCYPRCAVNVDCGNAVSYAVLFPSFAASDNFLLYARNTDIHVVSLGLPEVTDITLPLMNLTGAMDLDFDPVTEMIYWTDVFQDTINTANIDVRKSLCFSPIPPLLFPRPHHPAVLIVFSLSFLSSSPFHPLSPP